MPQGKYAKVIDTLPKLPVADLKYQEKVNLVKTKLVEHYQGEGRTVGASLLAEIFAKLRARKDEIEEKLSECNLKIEAVTQLMTSQYEAEGTTTLKLSETGQSVSIQLEPYAQVEDRDKFRQWCIEAGLERSLALPWQTLNAIAKERLLAGLPEPDGVKTYSRSKAVLRK